MSWDVDRDQPSVQVADVQRMFTEFVRSYPELRLYRAICEGAVTDDEVAGLLTSARPGQARPVLFLAALHELVLRHHDVAAARWYPSVTGGPVPHGDPWPEVRRTCLDHADELRATIATRATQTNEVNRVVHLAPLLAQAAVDVPGSPVALVEMGASAGLLLGLDRYLIEITSAEGDPVTRRRARSEPAAGGARPDDGRARAGGASVGGDPVAPTQARTGDAHEPTLFGDPRSPVICAGTQLDGPSLGGLGLPTIIERVGLDLAPVSLDDVDEVRWLEACLWPDVPGRLERFRAAVALLRTDPPTLVAGDMVDDIEAVAHSARAVASAAVLPPSVGAAEGSASGAPASDPLPGRAGEVTGGAAAGPPVHLVVVSSWAFTYVARDRRPLVAEALGRLAADGRPVSWLTAEPPGCVPGIPRPATDVDGDPPTDASTVLGARRWRAGVELPPVRWGTCHPHGTSLSWHPTP